MQKIKAIKLKSIHIRMEPSQYEALEKLMMRTNVSASAHIRVAIERYLKSKLNRKEDIAALKAVNQKPHY